MNFSILIPTWNNLPFLKLCVESIRKNSTYSHQIIVHVNDGSDGTLEWVKAQRLDYTHTPENVGVCLAMNMMRTKVKTDYMLFINDDMYALPLWDKAISDEIQRMPDNRFFISATTIQPHTGGDSIINADYGDTVETFREDALLREYTSYKMDDWMGATLPPNIVHRDVWGAVGGYSVEALARHVQRPRLHGQALPVRHQDDEGAGREPRVPLRDKEHHAHTQEHGADAVSPEMGNDQLHLPPRADAQGQGLQPGLTLTYDKGALRRGVLRSRLKAVWWVATKKIGTDLLNEK